MTMHDRGDRGHDAGKDLRSRRKAKTESAELLDRLPTQNLRYRRDDG